ncbi:DUF1674 domain-containing protein [Marinibaculum pumilum]|uniref:DUF1674 domain-containing protein n=1 Tax=Marinibaculum pumilum TaxID=1766165 RepID=A0ABV7KXU4_9PROT
MSEDAKRPAAGGTDAGVESPAAAAGAKKPKPAHVLEQAPGEIGGPDGPEPTRYGDWSFKGIASDF